MDRFAYRDGVLWCEERTAGEIAGLVGTPCYVYSLGTLRDHYRRLAEAFAPLDPMICFAVKSNANLTVLRELAALGAGMDLVSGGELHRAILAGVDPARCVYAGVGKTDREIRFALEQGIGWFNIESEQEFEAVAQIAGEEGKVGRAALRVNPDVDPKTHRYTSTGKKESKFGVDLERARAFFAAYGRDERLRLEGIHLHIGSPVYRIEAYEESIAKALGLIDDLAAEGFRVTMLDLGGGFGADYESAQSPLAADYAATIVPMLEPRVRAGLKIVMEPGRMIAANAGVLLTRVLYLKKSGDRTFVICDAGMNALMRPCHYGAFHFIWPAEVAPEHVPARRAKEPENPGLVVCDVVGPICESGDFLAQDRALPPVRRGDLVAVFGAGAYGMTMANRYNSVPLPAEVIVDGTQLRVVRRAESWDDLVEHELEPAEVC